MTSPWPPPTTADPSGSPTPSQRRPQERWGPLLGWLLLLVATGAALVAAAAQLPWASGELLSSSATEFDAGELVNRASGALPFAVLATFVGLAAATWFGVAALPTGVVGRVAVTVLVLLVIGLAVAEAFAEVSRFSPLGELLATVLLVAGLPGLLLLVLTWRGARRGAAGTAVACAGLAVGGAVVALVELFSGSASIELGPWVALLLALAGLGGAVLSFRSVPRRRTA